ncbi:unnamed protein product [Orchesella dallaii]|uniref:MBD domain-containing protein n=1 Tax=Orchesella dallaii TaxID=48710 RepID=A0ABP1PVH0_9HEXA
MPMLRTRRAAARTAARGKEVTTSETEAPPAPESSTKEAEAKEDEKMEEESVSEAPASTSTVTLRRKSATAATTPATPTKEVAAIAPATSSKEPTPTTSSKEPTPTTSATPTPTKESAPIEPATKEPEPEPISETEPSSTAESPTSASDSIEEPKSPAKDSVEESKPTTATAEPAVEPSSSTPKSEISVTEACQPPADSVEQKQSTSKEKRHIDDLKSLLPDTSYLINVSLGYGPEENLKQPLKGFTAEDEVTLFPVIDSMSSKLFTIVQKLTDIQKKEIETAVKIKKGILKLSEFPKVFLCQTRLMEPPSDADKSKSSKRAPHPFLLTEDENIFSEDKLKLLRAVLDAGWKREVVMRSPGSTGRKTGDVYYYSPDGTKFRSSKQVAQHLSELSDCPFTIENFSFAKVRISTNPDQEIVRKAYDGKSPPRAQAKPASPSKAKPTQAPKPEATKSGAKASTSKDKDDGDTRSVSDEPVKGMMSSRRSIQPPKRYSGDAVLLLSKRSKMQDDKRGSNSKGLMQMGMLPPKYPKGMEDSSSNLSEGMEYNEQGGNHEDASGGNSMKEIAEDSLFQISALRQSGGIDVDHMQKYVENQKKMAQKNLEQAAADDAGEGASPAQRPKKQERIPCSIRCPGMTGEIPNLQCFICLCLFHAECLGLPPNLTYNNFICQNCRDLKARQAAFQKKDAEASPTTSAVASTSARPEAKKIMIMKKPGEIVKRSPPPLIRATSLHQGGPPRRDIVVTATNRDSPNRLPQKVAGPSSAAMARGMGRGRGMSAPLMRSPATVVHPVHRTSDGSHNMHVMSRGSHMMRRGRGRPPTRGLPQLNNKSLTITHLPRMQPRTVAGPPPVPNLQPMSSPKIPTGKLPLPMGLPVKPRQSMPVVPNLMKPTAFKIAVPPPSLSGRTFKKVAVSPSTHHAAQGLKQSPTVISKAVSHIHAQGQVDKSVVSLVKRSPQTVCTIGTKKYVVLPKKPTPSTTIVAVGNGVSSKISYSSGDAVARTELIQKQEKAPVVTTSEGQNNGTSVADNANSSQGGSNVKVETYGNKTEAVQGETSNDAGDADEATAMEVDTAEGVQQNTGLAASNDSESVVA